MFGNGFVVALVVLVLNLHMYVTDGVETPSAVLLNTSPVCLPSSENSHDPRMKLVAAPASL